MFNKIIAWVGNVVWQKAGRKAIQSLLTTALTGLFLLVNSWLVAHAGFGVPDDQIHLWVMGIVAWAVTAIFGQSAVDVVSALKGTCRSTPELEVAKTQLKLELMKDVNNPATPTTYQDVMDKI